MESKEKLNAIRDHLLDEICWRLDKDEQFRIKFCLTNKTNEDIRKYVDGANGIDVIEKDLNKLEKYEKAIEIIKKKKYKVVKYINESWLEIGLAVTHQQTETTLTGEKVKYPDKEKLLTQEEYDLLKEVFGDE